jgi:hypothetical protein
VETFSNPSELLNFSVGVVIYGSNPNDPNDLRSRLQSQDLVLDLNNVEQCGCTRGYYSLQTPKPPPQQFEKSIH